MGQLFIAQWTGGMWDSYLQLSGLEGCGTAIYSSVDWRDVGQLFIAQWTGGMWDSYLQLSGLEGCGTAIYSSVDWRDVGQLFIAQWTGGIWGIIRIIATQYIPFIYLEIFADANFPRKYH